MKPNTAVQKRIKVSKRGKLRARHPHQNHYNAKESREYQIGKKHGYDSVHWLKRYRIVKKFLGNS